MPLLTTVVASTRPGRVGPAFGAWFADRARAHGAFEVEEVDLAEVGLPFLDEPEHPRARRYVHDHTKAWSATVSRADALVFVTPEYNHGYNAVLKNAVDFLHHEWADKAAGFVSYSGGVAAGTRAVQQLKPVLTCLRMTCVYEAVAIPFCHGHLGDDGRVRPAEVLDTAAAAMLDELARVTALLRPGGRSAVPA